MFECESFWSTDNAQDILNNRLFGKANVDTLEKDRKHSVVDSLNKQFLSFSTHKNLNHDDAAITKGNKVNIKNIKDTEENFTTNDDNVTASKAKSADNLCSVELKSSKENAIKRNEKRKKTLKRKSQLSVENDQCDLIVNLNSSTDSLLAQKPGCNETSMKKTKKMKKQESVLTSRTMIDKSNDDNSCNEEKISEQFRKIDTGKKQVLMKGKSKYDKFQAKLNRRLEGGQFRWINEQLYTKESEHAAEMFERQPKLFDVYHKGFESQVKNWPSNPVDVIVNYLKERNSELVVADFGCGDAKITRTVCNKVHSFDLIATNKHVLACDMKKVPLPNNCIDVAIFCLSLMGTNLVDFLLEAKRVLKKKGYLLIAEVKSRFENVDEFVNGVSKLGFSLTSKNEDNKMFVIFEFIHLGPVAEHKPKINLKPCIYKRR